MIFIRTFSLFGSKMATAGRTASRRQKSYRRSNPATSHLPSSIHAFTVEAVKVPVLVGVAPPLSDTCDAMKGIGMVICVSAEGLAVSFPVAMVAQDEPSALSCRNGSILSAALKSAAGWNTMSMFPSLPVLWVGPVLPCPDSQQKYTAVSLVARLSAPNINNLSRMYCSFLRGKRAFGVEDGFNHHDWNPYKTNHWAESLDVLEGVGCIALVVGHGLDDCMCGPVPESNCVTSDVRQLVLHLDEFCMVDGGATALDVCKTEKSLRVLDLHACIDLVVTDPSPELPIVCKGAYKVPAPVVAGDAWLCSAGITEVETSLPELHEPDAGEVGASSTIVESVLSSKAALRSAKPLNPSMELVP